MARLQVLGIALGIMLVGGFLWLREHDKRVRFEALSAQQRKTLEFNDKQISGLRESLVQINEKYMERVRQYKSQQKVVDDSTKKLMSKIEELVDQMQQVLPDSSKHLAQDIADVCKAQVGLVSGQLSRCDSLRAEADTLISRRDTVIWRLQDSRDGYKKLYEGEKSQHSRGGAWAVVGKVSALTAVIGAITHFVGWW